jgi:hypothetical protein
VKAQPSISRFFVSGFWPKRETAALSCRSRSQNQEGRMSNPFSEPTSKSEPFESKPAVPEFVSDRDPGDETDFRQFDTEPNARSGTQSGFRAAPLPSGL